ncbi:MAG: ATP-binding protein, partial [Acidobacteria bacterium]|nr:ATP-binding protein [Acidobacteriota bacterium]
MPPCMAGNQETALTVRSILSTMRQEESILAGQRLQGVLARQASAAFVGRERELQLLAESASGGGPVLTWIHGLPGIGKSALLREFAARATAAGSAILRIDCRSLEPTPEGFLSGLQQALRLSGPTVEAVNERISSLRCPVLVFDDYDVLRLLDGWIRQVFVPSLDQSARIVISGRFEPAPGWRAAVEWHGLLRAIPLDPLPENESLTLLRHLGMPAGEAGAIYRHVNGHPMALVLAGSVRDNTDWRWDSANSRSLMQQLSGIYLADVGRQDLRTAVEAASIVRLATRSMLAAMLPGIYRDDLYDELAALPAVEMTTEGLMIHEQVRKAVASWLKSSDPHRYGQYRLAAWRQVRAEWSRAERYESWRCTADMLYLARNPALSEAF